jgi:hypothetical protein
MSMGAATRRPGANSEGIGEDCHRKGSLFKLIGHGKPERHAGFAWGRLSAPLFVQCAAPGALAWLLEVLRSRT